MSLLAKATKGADIYNSLQCRVANNCWEHKETHCFHLTTWEFHNCNSSFFLKETTTMLYLLHARSWGTCGVTWCLNGCAMKDNKSGDHDSAKGLAQTPQCQCAIHVWDESCATSSRVPTSWKPCNRILKENTTKEMTLELSLSLHIYLNVPSLSIRLYMRPHRDVAPLLVSHLRGDDDVPDVDTNITLPQANSDANDQHKIYTMQMQQPLCCPSSPRSCIKRILKWLCI